MGLPLESLTDLTIYPRIVGSQKADLEFEYDAMGNRIVKRVIPKNPDGTKNMTTIKTTYYVRDAQSNIMASYTQTNTQEIALEEQPIYGSSRLGVYHPTTETGIVRGNRIYEGSNHLGNVLVTFSDRIVFENGDLKPATVSYSDYYAFGMPIKTRTNAARLYKFAFNGQVKDDEIYGEGNAYSAEFWEYDARIGRRWNVDPMAHQFPWQSPYSVFDNDPISKIDTDGLSAKKPDSQKQRDRKIEKFKNKEAKLRERTGLGGDALRAAMYQKYAGRKFIYIASTTPQGDKKVYGKNVGNDINGGQEVQPTGDWIDGYNKTSTKDFPEEQTPPITISMRQDGTFPDTPITPPALPPGATSASTNINVQNLTAVAGPLTITITQSGTTIASSVLDATLQGATISLPITNDPLNSAPFIVSVTNSTQNLTIFVNPLGLQGRGALRAPQVNVNFTQNAQQIQTQGIRSIYLPPGVTFKQYIKAGKFSF